MKISPEILGGISLQYLTNSICVYRYYTEYKKYFFALILSSQHIHFRPWWFFCYVMIWVAYVQGDHW